MQNIDPRTITETGEAGARMWLRHMQGFEVMGVRHGEKETEER
jgi:hypothetical protein